MKVGVLLLYIHAPLGSLNRTTLHKLRLYHLLRNSIVEYELDGVYKFLVQFKVKLSENLESFQQMNLEDLLILVDGKLVPFVLSDFYVIPL